MLHRMSFCFTNAREAAGFYRTLEYILPCPKCRRNFKNSALAFPKRAADFPEWVWRLHNRVTDSLPNAEEHGLRPSFAEVREMYTSSCHVAAGCEATFLLAIAETHPGSRAMSEEYLVALRYFIGQYLEKSRITV